MEGPDTRFVVTNLSKRNTAARALRGCLLPARPGRKPYQVLEDPSGGGSHVLLQGDSQPVSAVPACGLAYWLMWGLRVSMPKRSMWRVAQFDTLRLRLIKIAARVVEMKTMIRVHLPTSCPAQDILRFALGRIPRLVT